MEMNTESQTFTITSRNREAIGYTGTKNEHLVISFELVGDGNSRTQQGQKYKVTSIKASAFYGCSDLTSVDIPSSVTSIYWYTFSGCSALTSIVIPEKVTQLSGSTFCNCSALVDVTIPASLTKISNNDFYGCAKLTNVNYSGSAAQWNTLKSSAATGNDYLIGAPNVVCDYAYPTT